MKEIIHSENVLKPAPSFSQAVKVKASHMLFLAGQVGVDEAGMLVGEDAESQARQVFKNIGHLLRSAGASPKHVVKVTAYLTRRDDYAAYDRVRREFFGSDFPASSTVIVSSLNPMSKFDKPECLVEVEATAVID